MQPKLFRQRKKKMKTREEKKLNVNEWKGNEMKFSRNSIRTTAIFKMNKNYSLLHKR